MLGGNKSASMASMWSQTWDVIKVNFGAYQQDQAREVPLMAKRRFTSMAAKDLPKLYMKQLLTDVRPARTHAFVCTYYAVRTVRFLEKGHILYHPPSVWITVKVDSFMFSSTS